MKHLYKLLSAAIIPFLAACSVTQEVKDDASFEGLTRIYVENPPNVQKITSYYLNSGEINTKVVENIAEFLKSRGYEPVANKADAQIVFVPIWNFSLKSPLGDNPYYNGNVNTITTFNGYYLNNPQYYSTLEIQAYFPNREDWVWRGFSPLNMDRQNATSNMIKEQVRWCLEYFPPEKYPSRMEIYRAEKEKKRKEQENPFSHIKVEGTWKAPEQKSENAPSATQQAQQTKAENLQKQPENKAETK